jgi:hypothetical protein
LFESVGVMARAGYHAWRAISAGNHQLASPVLFQLRIQKKHCFLLAAPKTHLSCLCVCEFGSQRVIAGNRWNCFSGELQQLASEPVTDLIQESIAAWYKRWNHDRTIEYARSMTKGGGNEDNS